MKRLTIIGSTGSVGKNTLRVVEHLQGRFEVFGLAARSNVEALARQVAIFKPRVVALADASSVDSFVAECRRNGTACPEILGGAEGVRSIAEAPESDVVISAAVGAAGLEPTYAALRAGKRVALANKEAMVVAGELLGKTASQFGGLILPVDSEHNAIDQCLRAGKQNEVRKLILTASGGPFRTTPAEDFGSITPEEALNHPTWKMGRRITIDSATLINKGFEVIEASWLFDIPAEAIEVIVHPQSVVHSMVEFVDGSVVAQIGTADMRVPIQYALTYPERLVSPVAALDWASVTSLEFALPDREKFPCIGMAYQALEMGGTAPAVLNAADEIAVGEFLGRKISFTDVPLIIRDTLAAHDPVPADSVEAVLEADRWAREYATTSRASS
jgi:1-deoxy-D-xylulose-5-phosphate reductoisomerase